MTGGVKPDAGAAIAQSDVLAFWRAAGPKKWFDKDAAFDSAIARRFFSVWRAAGDGELAHWQETPEGALALVIVLDQFPRNMLRGDRALTRPTDSPATSPIEPSAAASIGRSHTPSASSSICRLCTLKISSIRNAAWSWRASTAMMNSPNTPSSMPTSSAASGASRIAMRCWAAPPGRTSKPSSIPADFPAERMSAPRRGDQPGSAASSPASSSTDRRSD